MITIKQPTKSIGMNNLQCVLFNEEFIQHLARLLVVDHISCFADMSTDADNPDMNFQEAKEYLADVNTSLAEGFLPTLLEDFGDALTKAVLNTKVEITSIKISKDGIDDVDASVS